MKKIISFLVLSVLFSFSANAFQRYSCTGMLGRDTIDIGPLTVGTACDAANSETSADFQTSPSSPHYKLGLILTNFGPAEKCQKEITLYMVNLDIRDMINEAAFTLDRERNTFFIFGYGPTDRMTITCESIN